MGQLCDDDCVSIFTKFDVKSLKHNRVIITGLRDRTNGLWNIPLGTYPPLNNHQSAPTPTKQTAFSAKTLPNANLPNTFTLPP